MAYGLTFLQSIFSRVFVTHTAVFCQGTEAAFNNDGIHFIAKGKEAGMIFLRSWVVGNSNMPHEVGPEQLALDMTAKYAAGTYKCYTHNCNHFTNDFLMSFVGKGCPWWVKLPAQVAAAVERLARFCRKLFATVQAVVGGPVGRQQQQPPPQEAVSCASGDSPALVPSPPTSVVAALSTIEVAAAEAEAAEAQAAVAAAAATAATTAAAAAAAVEPPLAPPPQPQPADAATPLKQLFKWHRPQWVKALGKKVQTVKGLFCGPRKQGG